MNGRILKQGAVNYAVLFYHRDLRTDIQFLENNAELGVLGIGMGGTIKSIVKK